MLFALWSSFPETTHKFFRREEGVSEQVLGFLRSSTGRYPRKENQPSLEKKNNNWLNFSIVYRLKKPITKTYSCNRIFFLPSMNYCCITWS